MKKTHSLIELEKSDSCGLDFRLHKERGGQGRRGGRDRRKINRKKRNRKKMSEGIQISSRSGLDQVGRRQEGTGGRRKGGVGGLDCSGSLLNRTTLTNQ